MLWIVVVDTNLVEVVLLAQPGVLDHLRHRRIAVWREHRYSYSPGWGIGFGEAISGRRYGNTARFPRLHCARPLRLHRRLLLGVQLFHQGLELPETLGCVLLRSSNLVRAYEAV